MLVDKVTYVSSGSPRVSRMPLVLKELLTSRRPRVFSRDAPIQEYIPSPHTGSEEYMDNVKV